MRNNQMMRVSEEFLILSLEEFTLDETSIFTRIEDGCTIENMRDRGDTRIDRGIIRERNNPIGTVFMVCNFSTTKDPPLLRNMDYLLSLNESTFRREKSNDIVRMIVSPESSPSNPILESYESRRTICPNVDENMHRISRELFFSPVHRSRWSQ